MEWWRRATVVALLLGITALSHLDARPRPEAPIWNMVLIVLYFGNEDASGLVPEIRWFRQGHVSPRHRLEALIKGPRREDAAPSLPATTTVRSVIVAGDLAVVDFSQPIVRDHPGGSAGELITVFSVVNTLAEIPGIRRVAWRVDGKPVETLVGHMDLSQPVARNAEFIVEPNAFPLKK